MVLDGASVVVPVVYTRGSWRELALRIEEASVGLGSLQVLHSDDRSSTPTWNQVQQRAEELSFVRGMWLGRNIGQRNALLAWNQVAQTPTIIAIEDGLQDPPEEIASIGWLLRSSEYEAVYGFRDRVEQSFFGRIKGRLTRWTLEKGMGISPASSVSSFHIFRTEIQGSFAHDLGTNVPVDALLSWGTSRFGSVTVKHDQLKEGKSNYTLGKLRRFAIDTTTGHSTVPLQVAFILDLATAGFGLCGLIYVTVKPLLAGKSLPGYPFLGSTSVVFSVVQLTTSGGMSGYLARMHFRIMRKPIYVVSEVTETSNSDSL